MLLEKLNRIAPGVIAAYALGATTLFSADLARADRRNNTAREVPEQSFNGRAAIAVVSIKDQRISVYDADGGALRAPISSGQTGYETPVGVFSLLQKNEEHYSNLYDDASMPFMQRITWSGVALHAGALPGYPASHGCVRLPYDFAKQIFRLTKLGMRIVISRNDIAPAEIAHRSLLSPVPIPEVAVATPTAYETSETDERSTNILKPDVSKWPARQALLEERTAVVRIKAGEAAVAVENWETLKANLKSRKKERALIAKRDRVTTAKAKAEERLAKAEKRLAAAKSSKAKKWAEKNHAKAAELRATSAAKLEEATLAAADAEKVITRLTDEITAADAAKTAALAAATEAKRETQPISVFISAKSQKLYVRQGNEAVFDTPVSITNPGQSIGTHIFTALDYANDGNDVRWNVVSISQGRSVTSYDDEDDRGDRRRGRKSKKDRSYAPPLTNAAGAAAALARISIPDEVRARISVYVWPGSSLIISDEELSKETGEATDFIIVASDEPQGALKTRPRQPPPSRYNDYFSDDYNDDYYRSYDSSRSYRRYRRPAPKYKSLFNWW